MQKTGTFFMVVVFLLAALGTGGAQVTLGTISGTVKDSTGAVIPDVNLTIRNLETGITRSAISDSAGRYTASQLGLGNYEITATNAGFQSVVRSGVELTVGRQAVVDFALQVGAVSEQVTVTGEAPLLETTNSTVADLVTEQQMRELPLNGRSFTDLTAIQPGAISDLGIPAGVFQGGGRIILNGARPQQSSYLLDGTDIVSPYSNVAPVSVMNQTLGVDTIREFTVLQNNYGAQYGRAVGGVVNAVTRSGTNAIHGSVFEFLRNEMLDAKNFFDLPDDPIPPFKRNQFGGTVGGPIVKDSTFYFFSFEGLRQVLGTTDFGTVLSDESRAGQITGCPGTLRNCSRAERIIRETLPLGVNPDIVPVINIIPRGTGKYLNDGLQDYQGSRKQPGRENYYMFRVDQTLGQNDTLFGRGVFDMSSKELPDAQFLDASKNLHTATNDWGKYSYLTIEWTHIVSPTVLNSARIGFARNDNNQCMCIDGAETKRTDADDYPGLPRQLEIIPGVRWGGPWGIPGVAIPGGHNGPGSTTNGADLDDPLRFTDNTFSWFDSMRVTRGRHSLDMGIDVRRFQENVLATVWGHAATSWFAPTKNFLTSGVAPYCTGAAVDCRGLNNITSTGVGQRPDSYRGWRQTYTAWYVQDDFKMLDNLTLNLGLRWEKVTSPWEVNGKAATFNDVLRDRDWTQLGKNALFNIRDGLKDFAPRFGLAWSPDAKTSVRGGFGTFKEIPLEYLFQLAIYYPPQADRLSLRNVAASPLRWPNPMAGVNAAAGTRQVLIINPDFKQPAGYQWNFGLERQVGAKWVARATYIGNRGTNLVGVLNQVQPAVQVDPTGREFTPAGAPSINPALDSTRTYASAADSFYHALQTRLQKRFSQGLEFTVSYTWSKNLGNGPIGTKNAETGGDSGLGSGQNINNLWNYKSYDMSRLDQDVRHNMTFNYTYELPLGQGKTFGNSMSDMLNKVLGGWQVNGIVSVRTGLPISLTGPGYAVTNFCRTCVVRPLLKPGGNNNPVIGDVNHYFDETQFQTVAPGYFGNVGRNTLDGPGQKKVDFSIFKMVQIREGRNLQLRAEFFNLPNHPNYAGPSSSLVFETTGLPSSEAPGGRITKTIGTSRQIQLALKFEF
ncbi:MAG: hypothetical protein EXQ56_10540 [Acidobacteria bacterium]|nr:hypothetical protein [Acidobacteriota bacterium]